jgi:hypothetical protein
VGIDGNIVTASFKAVFSAMNRDVVAQERIVAAA